MRLRKLVLGLALIAGLTAASVAPASAHNYWYANYSACTYDHYQEVSRPTGTHLHRYVYSKPMPSNYCTG